MVTTSKRLWVNRLCHYFNGAASEDILYRAFPIMPWIQPAVNKSLFDVILRLGTEKQLGANEVLYSIDRKISELVVVKSGIVARSINAPAGEAISISPPNHIACGNLNFFSGRPCFGKYKTITDCELIFCPKELLYRVCSSDPFLLKDLNIQLELGILSDRLAFSCLSLLTAEERLKAFSCSWALNFGHIDKTKGNGYEWIRMPYPLTRETRALLINASDNWVDKKIREWRGFHLWDRKGIDVWCKISLLEGVYQWMREREEIALPNCPKTLWQLFSNPKFPDRITG